jgi:hypothetical protein
MTDDRFPEALVTLLLAEYLLELEESTGCVEVAIDGASVSVSGNQIFDILGFLKDRGWQPATASTGRNEWTRDYNRNGQTLTIHSKPGSGDVVAQVGSRRFIAECKKGPPTGKKGSPERPLLNAALGQAITFDVGDSDVVLAAVPDTPAFRKLYEQWKDKPLVQKSGIKIVLVCRSGSVTGLCP